MTFEIHIAPQAKDAIKTHLAYIAVNQQSPLIASRVGQRIYDSITTLSTFPHRCPIAPESDFSDHLIRMLVIDGCPVLFTVDDHKSIVRVLAFRHGRQLLLKNLGSEDASNSDAK